jgi:hypothetical protein
MQRAVDFWTPSFTLTDDLRGLVHARRIYDAFSFRLARENTDSTWGVRAKDSCSSGCADSAVPQPDRLAPAAPPPLRLEHPAQAVLHDCTSVRRQVPSESSYQPRPISRRRSH